MCRRILTAPSTSIDWIDSCVLQGYRGALPFSQEVSQPFNAINLTWHRSALYSIGSRQRSHEFLHPFSEHINTHSKAPSQNNTLHWLVTGGLVQRVKARRVDTSSPRPPRCTKCNSLPTTGQGTNIILAAIWHKCTRILNNYLLVKYLVLTKYCRYSLKDDNCSNFNENG